MSTPNALQGAIQSQGTCWFYSIVNGFLLTEYGRKILYIGMKKLYGQLNSARKEYLRGTFLTCPTSQSPRPIEFYKFVNHYLGYLGTRGTPGRGVKLQRSANLLRIARRSQKTLQGTLKGGWPRLNIGPLMNHYGFKNKFVHVELNEKIKGKVKKDTLFVIGSFEKRGCSAEQTDKAIKYLRDGTGSAYSLMCASFIFGSTKANGEHALHAITGFKSGGQMYIFDSNQSQIFKCNWRDVNELKHVIATKIVPNFGSLFKNLDPFEFLQLEFLVFAVKSNLDNVKLEVPIGGTNSINHLSRNQVITMINKAFQNEPQVISKFRKAEAVYKKHRLSLYPGYDVTQVRLHMKNLKNKHAKMVENWASGIRKRARSGSAAKSSNSARSTRSTSARSGSAAKSKSARSGSAKKTRTLTVKFQGKTVSSLRV